MATSEETTEPGWVRRDVLREPGAVVPDDEFESSVGVAEEDPRRSSSPVSEGVGQGLLADTEQGELCGGGRPGQEALSVRVDVDADRQPELGSGPAAGEVLYGRDETDAVEGGGAEVGGERPEVGAYVTDAGPRTGGRAVVGTCERRELLEGAIVNLERDAGPLRLGGGRLVGR
jgi:hypothetical protein